MKLRVWVDMRRCFVDAQPLEGTVQSVVFNPVSVVVRYTTYLNVGPLSFKPEP